MRAPKWQIGATVIIPLEVENKAAGWKSIIPVGAEVTGVSYDPRNGTTGGPLYAYSVLPRSGTRPITVQEHDISAGANPV